MIPMPALVEEWVVVVVVVVDKEWVVEWDKLLIYLLRCKNKKKAWIGPPFL
jgi:hypothetical protein